MIMILSIRALDDFYRMFLCMDHTVYPTSIDLTNLLFHTQESFPGASSHNYSPYGIFLPSLCDPRCRTSSLEFAEVHVGYMKDHMMFLIAYDETILFYLYLVYLESMTKQGVVVLPSFVMKNLLLVFRLIIFFYFWLNEWGSSVGIYWFWLSIDVNFFHRLPCVDGGDFRISIWFFQRISINLAC